MLSRCHPGHVLLITGEMNNTDGKYNKSDRGLGMSLSEAWYCWPRRYRRIDRGLGSGGVSDHGRAGWGELFQEGFQVIGPLRLEMRDTVQAKTRRRAVRRYHYPHSTVNKSTFNR